MDSIGRYLGGVGSFISYVIDIFSQADSVMGYIVAGVGAAIDLLMTAVGNIISAAEMATEFVVRIFNPEFDLTWYDDWSDMQGNVRDFFKEQVEAADAASKAVNDYEEGVTASTKGVTKSFDGVSLSTSSAVAAMSTNLDGSYKDIDSATGILQTNTVSKWGLIKNGIVGKAEEIVSGAAAKWDEMKTGAINKATEIKDGLTEKWNGIKDKASEIWGGIRDTVTGAITEAKDAVSSTVNNLKLKVSNTFELLKLNIQTIFRNVESLVSKPFEDAKAAVSKIVDRIKELFDFKFTWPKIKTPRLTVSYSSTGTLAKAAQILGLPGMPKFDVAWAARGGILDGATLIGAGEAGREAILPLDRNTGWMDDLAGRLFDSESMTQAIANGFMQALSQSDGGRDIHVHVDGRELLTAMADANRTFARQTGRSAFGEA